MKLRMRLFVLLPALLLLAVGPSVGAAGTEEQTALRLGVIAPLTGEMQNLGKSMLEGVTLAVEEINLEGGLVIDGRRHTVEVVVRDAAGGDVAALAAAKSLINQEGVMAIVGPPTSADAIPVARLAHTAQVPMVTPIATHPDVTTGSDCAFRVCYTDSFQTVLIAFFAHEELGARKAAVLFDQTDTYNRTAAEIFASSFRELGGEVLLYSYTPGTPTFVPLLSAAAQSKPDVLFLPNYEHEVTVQAREARTMGLEADLLGIDTMWFRNREDIEAVDGAYFVSHFFPDDASPKVREFSRRYQERHERPPTTAGALAYDACGLLFDAVRRLPEPTPSALCRVLAETEEYRGVTGIMRFGGSGDPIKSAYILRARDGHYELVERFDP